MFVLHAVAIVTLAAIVGASDSSQVSTGRPQVTEAERQAAASAAASQGASVDAMNAKMPQERSEPTFGKEFVPSAREAIDQLERRMTAIDDSFDRARGKRPRRRQPSTVPAEPIPAEQPRAEPVPEPGDVRPCPERAKGRPCSVPEDGALVRKKAGQQP
jgi:hypothetical protein